ncbi:MAG TPA: ribonuclease H-like domain-containing protein [Pirellulales bacterium]
MLSEEVRVRLAQIHATRPREPSAPSIAIGLRSIASAGLLRPDPVPDLFERGQECSTNSGTFLRFRRQLKGFEFGQAGPPISLPDDVGAGRARATTRARLELEALTEHFPAGTVFLDLETCGFAGSPIFLIGLVWQPDGALVLDQLFARTYLEERAILEEFWKIAAANRVLVTFNGKSFDGPMVLDRSTRHRLGRLTHIGSPWALASPNRVAAGTQLAHCDLLHHARRRWKRVLPNCRLQTLERFVCGRARFNDLDGALVPAAYHHFVRTGQTREIGAILKHNALDLITLVELALKLTSPPVNQVASA